jgi:(1->4)-alpha-D-glucan 1-alpha-D-glucosylmutase
MLATSTHDNKRSEDARTRIDVLSEASAMWRLVLRRWSRLNERRKTDVQHELAPSRNDEYLLYQAMLGACPLGPLDAAALDAFRQRIDAYMLKAAREAKARTSWINPNEEYEKAISAFIAAILRPDGNPFLKDFLAVKERVARYGMLSSLSQTLIKLCSPGIPDFYQGTELWDFSLVDPDNRRPVDYELRKRNLEPLRDASPEELVKSMEDGRIKQYVVLKGLALRRDMRDLLELGDYVPLLAQGEKAEHVVAFARRHEGKVAIAVAPRLVLQLAGGENRLPLGEAWGDTTLPMPAGAYRNVLTGDRHASSDSLSLAELMKRFPVALLLGE